MKRALILVAGLATLVGCSNQNLHSMEGVADTGNQWETGTASDDSGAVEDPDPYWFALDAEVVIVEVVPVEVVVSLRLHPEDSEWGALCTDAPEVLAFEESAVPDPLVYTWLQLDLAGDLGACSGAERVPRTMMLGLGELYDPIVPGVEQHGLGEVKDSLYGAYASFDAPVGDGLTGTTYAYGYAGTEDDRLGTTPAVDDGPLPDGRYLVTAWYLFELLPVQ